MTLRLRFCILSAIAALGVAVALSANRAASQEPPSSRLKKGTGSELADANAVESSGGEVPVSLFQPSAKDDEKAEKSIREQDIYIPYEKLRQVFEKHGRGVFLPYEKFQELWQAAQDKTRPAAEPKPPVGALITEIENEATVEKDVVRVKAKVKIEVLAEGWNEIPLRLGRRRHHRRHARRQAGPDRRRARPGLPAADREERQAARADRVGAGVCQGDHADAGPEQRLVPGPAGAGEPLAGDDSAGGREGESPSADRRHGSARREEARRRRGEEARRDGRAGLRRRGADGPHRLDAQGRRRHRPGGRGQRAGRAAGLDQRGRRPHANHARPTRSAGPNWPNWRSTCRPIRRWSTCSTPTCASGRSSTVEGRQRITAQLFEPAKSRAAGDRRVGEVRRREGRRTRSTCRWSRPWAWARQQGVVVVQVAEGLRAEAAKTSGLLQVDAGELPARAAARQVGVLLSLRRGRLSSWPWASRRCSRGSPSIRWSRPASSPSG